MESINESNTNQEDTSNHKQCMELKNIKYKTMLLNGVSIVDKKTSVNDLSNLEKFLENEKNNTVNEPWSKLNKTMKTRKLHFYAEKYKEEKNITEEEKNALLMFFKDCLDRKKLGRVKDVVYDKTTGMIKDIPGLFYAKQTNHFTLKNIDKRVSTIKNLPTKKVQTFKNVNPVDDDDSEVESDDSEVESDDS